MLAACTSGHSSCFVLLQPHPVSIPFFSGFSISHCPSSSCSCFPFFQEFPFLDHFTSSFKRPRHAAALLASSSFFREVSTLSSFQPPKKSDSSCTWSFTTSSTCSLLPGNQRLHLSSFYKGKFINRILGLFLRNNSIMPIYSLIVNNVHDFTLVYIIRLSILTREKGDFHQGCTVLNILERPLFTLEAIPTWKIYH